MPSDKPVCARNVKASLLFDAAQQIQGLNARFGFVLGTPGENFDETCRSTGTVFDRFLAEEWHGISCYDVLSGLDEHTALFVIDMQKDFTMGSFGQTCWGAGGAAFPMKVAVLITNMSSRGATIIANKDYHPSEHCSFTGNDVCLNTKYFVLEDLTASLRYVNVFPSHTC